VEARTAVDRRSLPRRSSKTKSAETAYAQTDDDTRQLEETLTQSYCRHASRLQEELTRNRTDSADRLQLEIKVLLAEHAGLLEQKLAEIRLQHYQKVEEAQRLSWRVEQAGMRCLKDIKVRLSQLQVEYLLAHHGRLHLREASGSVGAQANGAIPDGKLELRLFQVLGCPPLH
jgi:hypothetical protein